MTDTQLELNLEVQQFKKLEEKFKEEFHKTSSMIYFVISSQWLNDWKQSVGYDGQVNTGGALNSINSDIGIKPTVVLKYEPLETHMWNTILREGLTEGIDYEIISEEMWMFLRKGNKVEFNISRDSYMTKENKKVVNVQLMKIKFCPLFPSVASKFKGGLQASLIEGDQYVSRTCTLKAFVELLEKTLQTVTAHTFLRSNSVRLYKAPPEWSYGDISKYMIDQMKDLKNQDSPCFQFSDAEYLDPSKIDTMEDCFIEPNQLIVMDVDNIQIIVQAKEAHKTWVIKNPIFPDEGKCEGCYQFKTLSFFCDCKKVSYCSDECKVKDEYYHMPKCEKQDSDEEKVNGLSKLENSKNGLTGIRNLGNTCFMNSGIQCISNTWDLTDYILKNEFKNEINQENPLGSKGQLVTKFSNLLKRMWFDSKSSIAPFSFKKIIGELQPQFQGYQQHDSQELITFLLDGIHEDLNRILKKPYIENPDSAGRTDDQVARESWDIYRQRNDSIIVDNMYGMYRSQLQCPACKKISITFDPYLMVNVAIPQDDRKIIKLSIVNSERIWESNEEVFHYEKSKNLKIKDVINEKGSEWLDAHADQVVLTCSSTYNTEVVFIDEMLHFLKKKLKYRKLFIRKLSEMEYNVPLDCRVIVLVHNSFYYNASQSWKKDFLEPQNFIFSRHETYQGIHMALYKAHLNILQNFPDYDPAWKNQNDEEQIKTYKNHVLDKFWVIEFKTNQKYATPCSFCQKEICNDCQIPFDIDTDLNSSLERCEKLMQCEFYIVWKTPFRFNGQIDDIYTDWKSYQITHQNAQASPEPQQQLEEEIPTAIPINGAIPLPYQQTQMVLYDHPVNHKEQQFTLQECLNFSTKPEQLAEDNTWYCSNCKDHVQAFKTMKIYVAPKVLIFHLKRFKDSNKSFKSKLQTFVDFPVDGFDMKEFLSDPRLPVQLNSDPSANYSTIYDLYAVCNHFGGMGGGHYTAYCKNHLDGKWYSFDDQKVTEVPNQKTIVGPQAYVLFYKKRNDSI